MTAPPDSPAPIPFDTGRIELRLLRYFLAVVEELHFGRAAKRLHMTQPPLSRAIRKLEDQLGVDLLERSSGGVTPTKAGRAFAEEARGVLSMVDRAVAEARRAGGADAPVRLGSVLHLPVEPLLRLVRALDESDLVSNPEVRRLPAVEQVKRLRSGELDLATFPYAEDHDGLELEPLFPGEPIAAYVARDHPLATKKALGPDDLREGPIFVYQSANPALWDLCRARFEEAGYRFGNLRDMAGSNDGRDAILAVADGSGVALLPASILETSQAGSIVARLPLDPPVSMPDTVLGWSASPPRQLGNILGRVRRVAHLVRQSEA
jgi:DNA-binding transcriptional LysR family regulator